jgi:hypothetical protein
MKPQKSKQQTSSLVGNKSLILKEMLLSHGAIFTYQRNDMIYLVSYNEHDYATLQIFMHDVDYVEVYCASYGSLEELEASEPLRLSLFSIVYTLPASALSMPATSIPERSDIIVHAVSFCGLAWHVEDITGYEVPEQIQPPDSIWQGWIVRLSRPINAYCDEELCRFVLVLFNGVSWYVVNPIGIQAPVTTKSLDEIQCFFAIPKWKPLEER